MPPAIEESRARDDIPALIKDLAGAVSSAVEVQNRYWLAVALTSLFVLVPQGTDLTKAGLPLPFGLPEVDRSWFSLLAVLVLSALITAFSAAQARAVRTASLALRVLDDRRREGAGLVAGHDERDFFDALRRPSLGQVASLAQVLRGREQFAVDQTECPAWRRNLSKIVYVFFKIPSLIVWIALPAVALYLAFERFRAVGPPEPLSTLWIPVVWLLVFGGALALMFATWLEIAYLLRALRRV